MEQTCAGKLETLSLQSPEVRAWREQALGAEPPFEPTLVRLRGDQVRAWTGLAMGARLAHRLGSRKTLQLVRAFGELRQAEVSPTGKAAEGMGRRQLLAGLGLTAGLVLVGKNPAFAESRAPKAAEAWVSANRNNLPHRYAEFAVFALPFRQAIFAKLTPAAQGQLWKEHLSEYRATHAGLTSRQLAVIDRASDLLSRESTFSRRDTVALEQLSAEAKAAFGAIEAHRLIATLGPADDAASVNFAAAIPDCTCSTLNDWCSGTCRPSTAGRLCIWHPTGCGAGWIYQCNGRCG
ncbi:bacteriocin fulvocin C-related protein [Micromonospora sp. NPDC048898]|uniref:bacteriocin fulvocin C-related protein n=1 Tax=Micromonospora sp. NPDC048898 TaxID=3364260 RepID=UPI00371574C6